MGRGGSVVWAFGNASAAGAAVTSRNLSVAVLEDQTDGQLIENWSLDCQTPGGWSPCHSADTGIGHKRIINVVRGAADGAVSAMRINVLSHFAMPGQVPWIRRLEVYDWESKQHCV